jgi:hypothetical protein
VPLKCSLRGFSWQHGITHFTKIGSASGLRLCDAAINSAGDFLGSMGLLSSRALSALLITSRDIAPPFVRLAVLEELPTGLNRAREEHE